MEVEGVVAAFATDTGEATSAEWCGEVADEEPVHPDRPYPERTPDAVGTSLRTR